MSVRFDLLDVNTTIFMARIKEGGRLCTDTEENVVPSLEALSPEVVAEGLTAQQKVLPFGERVLLHDAFRDQLTYLFFLTAELATSYFPAIKFGNKVAAQLQHGRAGAQGGNSAAHPCLMPSLTDNFFECLINSCKKARGEPLPAHLQEFIRFLHGVIPGDSTHQEWKEEEAQECIARIQEILQSSEDNDCEILSSIKMLQGTAKALYEQLKAACNNQELLDRFEEIEKILKKLDKPRENSADESYRKTDVVKALESFTPLLHRFLLQLEDTPSAVNALEKLDAGSRKMREELEKLLQKIPRNLEFRLEKELANFDLHGIVSRKSRLCHLANMTLQLPDYINRFADQMIENVLRRACISMLREISSAVSKSPAGTTPTFEAARDAYQNYLTSKKQLFSKLENEFSRNAQSARAVKSLFTDFQRLQEKIKLFFTKSSSDHALRIQLATAYRDLHQKMGSICWGDSEIEKLLGEGPEDGDGDRALELKNNIAACFRAIDTPLRIVYQSITKHNINKFTKCAGDFITPIKQIERIMESQGKQKEFREHLLASLPIEKNVAGPWSLDKYLSSYVKEHLSSSLIELDRFLIECLGCYYSDALLYGPEFIEQLQQQREEYAALSADKPSLIAFIKKLSGGKLEEGVEDFYLSDDQPVEAPAVTLTTWPQERLLELCKEFKSIDSCSINQLQTICKRYFSLREDAHYLEEKTKDALADYIKEIKKNLEKLFGCDHHATKRFIELTADDTLQEGSKNLEQYSKEYPVELVCCGFGQKEAIESLNLCLKKLNELDLEKKIEEAFEGNKMIASSGVGLPASSNPLDVIAKIMENCAEIIALQKQQAESTLHSAMSIEFSLFARKENFLPISPEEAEFLEASLLQLSVENKRILGTTLQLLVPEYAIIEEEQETLRSRRYSLPEISLEPLLEEGADPLSPPCLDDMATYESGYALVKKRGSGIPLEHFAKLHCGEDSPHLLESARKFFADRNTNAAWMKV